MKKRKSLSVVVSAFLVVCCCMSVLTSLPDRSASNSGGDEGDVGVDSSSQDEGESEVEPTRRRPATTTPRPTATRLAEVTVKVNQANVRSGPGTGYPVVATVERDTQLRLVAADGSGDWYNVTWSNGERGWVWHENVEASDDVGDVRVAATIPALPTGASVGVSTPGPAAATSPPTERPPVCECSGDTYNCGSFSSQRAAQACFNYCLPISGDIHRLDGDNDGRVCE